MPVIDFEAFYEASNQYLRLFDKAWVRTLRKGEFKKQFDKAYGASFVPGQSQYIGGHLQPEKFDSRLMPHIYRAQTGLAMETIAMSLRSIGQEIMDARKSMDEVYKSMVKTHSILGAQMTLLVKDLRSKQAEMTIEVNSSISTMKEVRNFFSDKEHKVQMERLKEFIKVCQELKVLIDDGTLDAVVNAIPNLKGGD